MIVYLCKLWLSAGLWCNSPGGLNSYNLPPGAVWTWSRVAEGKIGVSFNSEEDWCGCIYIVYKVQQLKTPAGSSLYSMLEKPAIALCSVPGEELAATMQTRTCIQTHLLTVTGWTVEAVFKVPLLFFTERAHLGRLLVRRREERNCVGHSVYYSLSWHVSVIKLVFYSTWLLALGYTWQLAVLSLQVNSMEMHCRWLHKWLINSWMKGGLVVSTVSAMLL